MRCSRAPRSDPAPPFLQRAPRRLTRAVPKSRSRTPGRPPWPQKDRTLGAARLPPLPPSPRLLVPASLLKNVPPPNTSQTVPRTLILTSRRAAQPLYTALPRKARHPLPAPLPKPRKVPGPRQRLLMKRLFQRPPGLKSLPLPKPLVVTSRKSTSVYRRTGRPALPRSPRTFAARDPRPRLAHVRSRRSGSPKELS